jgi:CHASE1-domain containing sensor protein/nitrogen-specific signal transduction histidine kinase
MVNRFKKFFYDNVQEEAFIHSRSMSIISWILSLAMLYGMWFLSEHFFFDRAQKRFEHHASEHLEIMKNRIQQYENTLRGGVGFFHGSDKVTRADWHQFVAAIDPKTHNPGMQGIGYSMMIAPDNIAMIEEKIRKEGYTSFEVKPKGERELYSAILYLEPCNKRNDAAIGYDMYSEPIRHDAMKRAAETGMASLSGRVTLLQEIDHDIQSGVLIYLPYYAHQEWLNTIEERRRSLLGYVYAPLRMGDFINSLMSHKENFYLEIYDGEGKREDSLLYKSPEISTYSSHYHSTRTLNIGGRTWYITYSSTPAFDVRNSTQYPILFALVGLILYLLLMYIILELLKKRSLLKSKTEALKHEKELAQDSEAFYRTVFGSIEESIVVLKENRVVDCNDVALRLFDTTKERFLGQSILDTAYEIECQDYSLPHHISVAYSGEFTSTRCTLRLHKNPNVIKIVEFSFSRFGTLDKNKLVMISRDITRKVEEEKLLTIHGRQAQMGEMISMIAHQWRQPLAIINAITTQMRLKAMLADSNDNELVDNLQKIEQQSTHLSQTISEYRDFFRPDKPKERFHVLTLIDHSLNLIDHTLKSHSIHIENDRLYNPVLYTYRNEVLQVLIVLLKNALDAFVENKVIGGEIIIRVKPENNSCVISVRDNAGGIAPSVMYKLFSPYFTTKNENNGTGLGLYMSRMIIEDHCGGSIEAMSEGNTTTFNIKLPCEEEKNDI